MGNVRHYLLIKVADSISSPSGLITFSSFRQTSTTRQSNHNHLSLTFIPTIHLDNSSIIHLTTIFRLPHQTTCHCNSPTFSPSPFFICNFSLETSPPSATLDCLVTACPIHELPPRSSPLSCLDRPRPFAIHPEQSNQT